jgi:hypothetical protein
LPLDRYGPESETSYARPSDFQRAVNDTSPLSMPLSKAASSAGLPVCGVTASCPPHPAMAAAAVTAAASVRALTAG